MGLPGSLMTKEGSHSLATTKMAFLKVFVGKSSEAEEL